MLSALLVEDDVTAKVALLRILGRHGWWVDASDRVEEVLGLLEGHPPDLVVINRDVECGSGMSLLLAIKSHPRWRLTPVVLTCSRATLLDVAEALESGAADFLRQPFEPADAIRRLTALAQQTA